MLLRCGILCGQTKRWGFPYLVMYSRSNTVPVPMRTPMMMLSLRLLRPIIDMTPFSAGTCAAVLLILLVTLLSI